MKRLCTAAYMLILALSASFALVLFCTACSSSSPPKETFAGTWELQALDSQDPSDSLSSEQITELNEKGFEMNLVLSDDGSAEFSLFGETIEGVWTEKDASKLEITLGDDTFDASLQGKKLCFTLNDDTFTFAKQGA